MEVPPAAPIASFTFPALTTNIAGLMGERGLFLGLAKLFGDGGSPKSLMISGNEKSSISSLNIIPVLGDIISAHINKLTVLVAATASPLGATTEIWEVPWSFGS
jgi:hypothetical protein